MCTATPELDLVGVPKKFTKSIRGVLVSSAVREDGAFGAITLYSRAASLTRPRACRLLESVSQHASSALNNALTFEKTRESALTDPLTDLPNSRAFYMMLEQRIAEGQRLNKESLAVISLDVDDFKKVNDAYGHAVGDRMLASIAKVIKKEMRQMDILARYAGDEFVAIMPMASAMMASWWPSCIPPRSNSHFPGPHRARCRGRRTVISCFPTRRDDRATMTAAARNMQRQARAQARAALSS